MNPPKIRDVDYIQFLIAAQRVYTCTEAAQCAPDTPQPPAHDAFVRLLHRQPPDTVALWQEVKPYVQPTRGVLILDDTTLDKPYARQVDLVTRHWSGKHHRVVQGINLLTLVWTDGTACLPCDCRIYDKPLPNGQTKNEYFRAMVATAKSRGFAPTLVCFDSWYSSLDNLKAVRAHGWLFLTRLKHNRLVNPDGQGNVPLSSIAIPTNGRTVHLKGFGFVQVFRTVAPNGDADYWATNKLDMLPAEQDAVAAQTWAIEEYHRGLKQCCGVERAQVRKATAQRNHILLAVRAFVRLEVHRLASGVSWYAAKTALIRDAIRAYLMHPTLRLDATA
ncbi:MAG: transposase [Chloroflexota bacterium]|nr:transposase [Chloroflexota bacterium]